MAGSSGRMRKAEDGQWEWSDEELQESQNEGPTGDGKEEVRSIFHNI